MLRAALFLAHRNSDTDPRDARCQQRHEIRAARRSHFGRRARLGLPSAEERCRSAARAAGTISRSIPPTRRLFISRGTKVVVLNVDTGTVSGEIPNTDGVHGIAFAPEFDRGFTSNGRAGTVTIFDLQSLQVIGSAKTGMNPDAIVYDPASKRVFTMNGQSNDATAIDAATGNVLGTIPVTGKPEFARGGWRGACLRQY